jgi:uncharacterized protein
MMRWIAALLLLMTAGAAQAQTFPKFTGYVVDAANVLSPETEAVLTTKLEALQKDTKRQVVVATVSDTQGYPLDEYGYRLGRNWGVGLRDVNNGAVLFAAPNNPGGQRGPRLEVGTGLEPILTDAFSSVMIQQQMMPRLRAGDDINSAMIAGVDAIDKQLRASPEEAQARTDAAIKEFDRTHKTQRRSSGGGIPIGLIFWLVVLGFVILPAIFGRKHGRGRRFSNDGGALPIVLWSIANEIGRSGQSGGGFGGGWSGGSSDGGGGGGWGDGGFSGGGGGGFSGGGASGDW